MVVLGLLLIKTIYFQIESNISISFLKCHLTLLLCATSQLFPATSSESFIFANGGGEGTVPSHFSCLNIIHFLGENLPKHGERDRRSLIIMCGCDLLNCKVHLNPPANYGMLCGSVSSGAVKIGLSR